MALSFSSRDLPSEGDEVSAWHQLFLDPKATGPGLHPGRPSRWETVVMLRWPDVG